MNLGGYGIKEVLVERSSVPAVRVYARSHENFKSVRVFPLLSRCHAILKFYVWPYSYVFLYWFSNLSASLDDLRAAYMAATIWALVSCSLWRRL